MNTKALLLSKTDVTFLGSSEHNTSKYDIPLFIERISAGFPSPAEDYVEHTLDLNELCIQRPAATFFLRVEGDSMIDAGIYPDDILVVDRSITAQQGDIVIANLQGEFTVKELEVTPKLRLIPRNKNYSPIEIAEGIELEIFGVVTNVVRRMMRQR